MSDTLLKYFQNEFKKEPFLWAGNRESLKKRLAELENNFLGIYIDTEDAYPYMEWVDRLGLVYVFSFLIYEKNVRMCCCNVKDTIGSYNLYLNGVVYIDDVSVTIYFFREGEHRYDKFQFYLSPLYRVKLRSRTIVHLLSIREWLVSPVSLIIDGFFSIVDREMQEAWKLLNIRVPSLKDICTKSISENEKALEEFRTFPYVFKKLFTRF